jgi:hypothetical protein
MTLEVFAPAAPTPQKTFTPATDSFCQIFGLADIAALSQFLLLSSGQLQVPSPLPQYVLCPRLGMSPVSRVRTLERRTLSERQLTGKSADRFRFQANHGEGWKQSLYILSAPRRLRANTLWTILDDLGRSWTMLDNHRQVYRQVYRHFQAFCLYDPNRGNRWSCGSGCGHESWHVWATFLTRVSLATCKLRSRFWMCCKQA